MFVCFFIMIIVKFLIVLNGIIYRVDCVGIYINCNRIESIVRVVFDAVFIFYIFEFIVCREAILFVFMRI